MPTIIEELEAAKAEIATLRDENARLAANLEAATGLQAELDKAVAAQSAAAEKAAQAEMELDAFRVALADAEDKIEALQAAAKTAEEIAAAKYGAVVAPVITVSKAKPTSAENKATLSALIAAGDHVGITKFYRGLSPEDRAALAR